MVSGLAEVVGGLMGEIERLSLLDVFHQETSGYLVQELRTKECGPGHDLLVKHHLVADDDDVVMSWNSDVLAIEVLFELLTALAPDLLDVVGANVAGGGHENVELGDHMPGADLECLANVAAHDVLGPIKIAGPNVCETFRKECPLLNGVAFILRIVAFRPEANVQLQATLGMLVSLFEDIVLDG
jgi:hypothetical protein